MKMYDGYCVYIRTIKKPIYEFYVPTENLLE